MAELERIVAGMSCREVLADLSDYIDGNLTDERVAQIRAHVQDCDWCERFGGEFSAVVKGLRELLAEPEPIDDDVEQRLLKRLRQEYAPG